MIENFKGKAREMFDRIKHNRVFHLLAALSVVLLVWLLRRWVMLIAVCLFLFVGTYAYLSSEKSREQMRHLERAQRVVADALAYIFGNPDCKLKDYVAVVPPTHIICQNMEFVGSLEIPRFRVRFTKNILKNSYDNDLLTKIQKQAQSQTVAFWSYACQQSGGLWDGGQPIYFERVEIVRDDLVITVLYVDSPQSVAYLHDLQSGNSRRPFVSAADEDFKP